jgi:hypothetical protein
VKDFGWRWERSDHMIRADCDWIRDDLDAFVDGELRGAELRLVAQHLESCRRCAEEIESRETLGGLIRASVADGYQSPIPGGLAAGVVARVRAESYFSWRAGLSRAVEDWHWVIVGGGAVASTFLAMLFCSALLVFGTAAPDGDSLSALGANLRSSPGSLYAEVSRQGGDQNLILVQLDTGEGSATPLPLILRRADEEQRFVDALGEALLRGGPMSTLATMPEAERRYAEWLLENIARVRRAEPAVGPLGALTVHRLHLVTNTDVTAKGLE